MYRLLIADDEMEIREGVARFVQTHCPDWEVVAQAEDGRQALSFAKQHLPDAILTDITMPYLNGLEFLEQIAGVLPDAKLIVLSGYDQFEYAVHALRLGVAEYLLKPLDTKKLIEILASFAREIDTQQQSWLRVEQLQQTAEKRAMLERQQYYVAALKGLPLPLLTGENTQLLQGDYVYACVLCTGKNLEIAKLVQAVQTRLYTIATVLEIPPENYEEHVLVLYAKKPLEQSLFLQLAHTFTAVAVTFQRNYTVTPHFFMGNMVEQIALLHVSARQAREARQYVFAEDEMPVTTYEDVIAGRLRACQRPSQPIIDNLLAAVACENRTVFFESSAQLFAWFHNQTMLDAIYVRTYIVSLCYILLQDKKMLQKLTYYEYANVHNEMMEAQSLTELQTCFESFVRLCWLHESAPSLDQKTLQTKVEDIVRQHLDDVEFSLDTVAAVLFISPNYLRQLFKQETGLTFTEFLTNKRMQHAQVLLGSPYAKVNEVAEKVGYNDARYFSVCFKKLVGLTPSEYQQRHRAAQ